MGDTCPHCDHSLRSHRMRQPVFDSKAVFACTRCGCQVNGSVESLMADQIGRRGGSDV